MLSQLIESMRDQSPPGVRFAQAPGQISLTAERDLDGIASGGFVDQTCFVSFAAPADATFVGFSFTQFALPLLGDANQPFDLAPQSNLRAPAAVVPLLIQATDEVVLLAPLDSWHEQIFGVHQDDQGIHEFRWGWHGDLDVVPAGFTTTLAVIAAPTPSAALRQWGQTIRNDAGTKRLDPAAHVLTSELSYWTDNGAAYWYRTEPGLDLQTTLERKLAELDELGVRIGSVELDSWFYEHEITRNVSDVGYLDEVPPTGMLTWQPRADVLPDGVDALRQRLGGRPLTLHARHISAQSPYLQHGDWWIDQGAHPIDPSFFETWCHDARAWGASVIEQDWMLLVWFGVRQLRAEPGRALAWQKGLDDAAGAHDLGLMWCMSTPGDMMATVELSNVIAMRTSDDYRFADDPAFLWRWYVTVNRLAEALDLVVSKDCFFTSTNNGASSIDGDPHAELEALLSAMSAGVVGIGDRIGCTDPAIVERLCRADGRLVQPDRPIAIADQSFFTALDAPDALLWAETANDSWTYVVAMHTASTAEAISDSFALGGDFLIYNWRTQEGRVGSEIVVELGHRDWAFFVVCPITVDADGNQSALVGDIGRYATMGHLRLDGPPPTDMHVWRSSPTSVSSA